MSNYNEFEYGTTVTVRCLFKLDDVLTDPTTVDLRIEDPSGDISDFSWAGATVTRNSVGNFSKDIVCSEAGEWEHRWTATGPVQAVKTRRFTIRRQGV